MYESYYLNSLSWKYFRSLGRGKCYPEIQVLLMEYCFFADCRTIVGIAVGKAISIVPPIEASANEAYAIKALSDNNCGMSKGASCVFYKEGCIGSSTGWSDNYS